MRKSEKERKRIKPPPCTASPTLKRAHEKKTRKAEKEKEKDGADINKMLIIHKKKKKKNDEENVLKTKKISRQRKKNLQTKRGNVMTPNKKYHSPKTSDHFVQKREQEA